MPRFKKHVKKLPRHFQQVILDAVEDISWQILTPVNLKKATGQVLVHKFTMGHQLTLMAYKVENDFLVLYQLGPHENFYKNLKKYLKGIQT